MSSPDENETSSDFEVDLDPEIRREIRDIAKRLPQMTYYEVLGIERDADSDGVRDAFFQRSRRFHPDRFFRKNLGPYGALINEIYKRVVAAHDVLRDPELRKPYDRSLGPATPAAEAARPAARAPSEGGERRKKPRSGGGSLRSRPGLRRKQLLAGLQNQIDRGRVKAERRYDEARASRDRGDWVQAVANLRLALAFAPGEEKYLKALEEVLPRANEERAAELRTRAEIFRQQGDAWKAYEMLSEVVDLQPTDAELAHDVAQIALELQELPPAIEYARRAVALDEGSTEFRKTLARLLRAAGKREEARREFQRVWQFDPQDTEAKAALEHL